MRAVMALVSGAVLALLTTGLVAAQQPSARAVDTGGDMPILGQVLTMGTAEVGDPAVLSVHGVRRVEGATIVYWSVGDPASSESRRLGLLGGARTDFFLNDSDWLKIGDVALIDSARGRAFRPLAPGSSADCVCSPIEATLYTQPGTASVLWAGVAPLPDEVDVVDVVLGDQVVLNVPVEEGFMEPTVEGEGSLVLGIGWPKIDEGRLARAGSQEPAAYDLISRVSDLEETITKSEGEVALNADVLFSKNSAEVSGPGREAIEKAAAQIKEAKAGKQLRVVGHADSDGSDPYNLDLSKRRAAAVGALLGPLVGSGFEIETDGKGSSEPIAGNETDEGKAKNRRVSITYTEGS